LMEAGWVHPRGRRMTPGRPLIWVTTKEFLTHFGLDTLGDLPGIDELRAAGLLDLTPPVLAEAAPVTEVGVKDEAAIETAPRTPAPEQAIVKAP